MRVLDLRPGMGSRMDLSREVTNDLWRAVSNSYEGGRFSHAILDTMQYLSAAIRDKSGLDGDGGALVGQAFGGESPPLRVNSMQTESERSIQKGVEQIIRGLYLGVRNPRSHNQVTDSKATADAIIVFVDYLLLLLEAAREAFTPETFIEKIVDPEFVDSGRYAELIIKEIPAMRRGEALTAIYRERSRVDLRKAANLVRKLTLELSEPQIVAYLAVVSEQLRVVSDDVDIRTSLQMLQPSLWPRLNEVARLRIENKLINGIEAGKAPTDGKVSAALATWSSGYLKVFTLRERAEVVLISKLMWEDLDSRHYVTRFFMMDLPEVILKEASIDVCVNGLAAAVRNNDEFTRARLVSAIKYYPSEWQDRLAAALIDLADTENPAVRLKSGAPFLSSSTTKDDDIPF